VNLNALKRLPSGRQSHGGAIASANPLRDQNTGKIHDKS
jgi:hypothetical protein